MPGKTIWHLTMSLDGFMADQNDSIAWMSAASAPAPLGDAIVPTIGAILPGRHTYDVGITVAEPDGGRPHGGAYSGPVFVLTHEAPETSPIPEVRFLTEGLDAALATARDAAGERNVVIFGADLGQHCLDKGELDEVLVHVAPVFIGAGTPAYRSEGAAVVEFDVLESFPPGELTTLRLRPRKEGP